jgi:pimeloyl-ACP methyl ester carboxylesterase
MRHAPWLALALAAGPAFADAPADVLDKAPSKFAKNGDAKVHYKALGDGKTAVVFVHGWCCDLTVWRPQAAAFAGKARLVFLDLPGYGRSDKPKGEYTLDLFARGIDAVLKDAGVEKAVLVGHSMGTPVVRQFYRLYPDKTKGLVFVDGALRAFTKDKAEADKFLGMFQEETFKDTVPKFFDRMFRPDTPAAVRKQVEGMVAAADPRVAISSMKGMLDEKYWAEDPVKVPAQALMAKSPFWTEDYKAFAKKLVPELDYREFDGVGHFLFLEKPKEFNEALGEFLTKQGVTK